MLNFVIAILSNVYEKMNENSSIVYLKTIIELHQSLGYCPQFSSLVSAVPVYDLLFLPIVPFVLYMKCETLNQ